MRKHLRISLEGKVYDVIVEDVTDEPGSTFYQTSSLGMPAAPAPAVPMTRASPAPAGAVGLNDKIAPLGGMIVEVSVKVGHSVKAGQQVLVLEAMKMKSVIGAHKDGTVTDLPVKVGDVVNSGQLLFTIS
jgi:glutaconyl-CoA/methylmalonyl-CoA decarboxylase subunit gamma